MVTKSFWRYTRSALIVVAVLLFTTAHASAADANVYRLFNPTTGDHFYTINNDEKTTVSCTNPSKYVPEGIGFNAYTNSAGNIPVYRMYNPKTIDHFFTVSLFEKNIALSSGYTDEGVKFYIPMNQSSGDVPVYRAFRPDTGDHFYTTNPAEVQFAVQYMKYSDEGVAFITTSSATVTIYRMKWDNFFEHTNYPPGIDLDHHLVTIEEKDAIACAHPTYKYEFVAFSAYAGEGPGRLPVRRFLTAGGPYASSFHFYTTSEEEIAYARQSGWIDEGVVFYVPVSGSQMVYRLNGYSAGYLYTTDVNEKNYLQYQRYWNWETIAWNADPPCLSGCSN